LYAPLSPLAFNTLNPRKTIMAAAAKDEDAPLTIFFTAAYSYFGKLIYRYR